MDYLSAHQLADKWGISQRMVQRYLKAGRIDGAVRIGPVWMIPAAAIKPEDGRKNNRRQPKKQGDDINKNKPNTVTRSVQEDKELTHG
jgi:transcriptional antiterminator